jgi:hypothetical protein
MELTCPIYHKLGRFYKHVRFIMIWHSVFKQHHVLFGTLHIKYLVMVISITFDLLENPLKYSAALSGISKNVIRINQQINILSSFIDQRITG